MSISILLLLHHQNSLNVVTSPSWNFTFCFTNDNTDMAALWHHQGYVPSRQDILLARKATKGINEHQVMIKGVPFMFIDVGGQRSQRQKWFQCFEGITSILFLASASEFDQVTNVTITKIRSIIFNSLNSYFDLLQKKYISLYLRFIIEIEVSIHFMQSLHPCS